MLEPDSGVTVVGPQVFEASRLANFTSYNTLTDYCHQRAKLGLQQMFNVYIICSDGYVATMPGEYIT